MLWIRGLRLPGLSFPVVMVVVVVVVVVVLHKD
jgi:hypothetical protein